MVKIVIVSKGKAVKTANVNKFSVDTLHKKCKFRSADDFKKRTTWKLDNNTNVSVYAKDTGRVNTENKYDFPPPIDNDLYYGNVALVAHTGNELKDDNIVNFTEEQWTKLYEKLFGGFEDLGNDSEYSSEEEVDPENLTKEGYEKDGFVVSDGELGENKKISIYNSDEDSDYVPDNVSENSDEEEYGADGEDMKDEDDKEDEGDDDEDENVDEDEDEDDDEDSEEEEDEDSEEEEDEDAHNSELSEDEYEYE